MIIEILLSQLDSDKNRISYRRDWNKITGSVTATILLQQTYYWYQKNGFKPFYKFKEPLRESSRHYNLSKVGDDWCSELGFTRKEFDGALSKIGFRRTSSNKGERHAKFIEYWIDARRITHYKLNMVNFLSALLDLSLKYKTDFSYSTKEDIAKVQKELYIKYKTDFSYSTFCTLHISDTTFRDYTETTTKKDNAHEKITTEDIEDFELLEKIEQLEAEEELPKKVAPKKGFENEETPNWMEVALAAIEYVTKDQEGIDQWNFMCKGVLVAPDDIMTAYFGKYADAPYILRNWKKQIPGMSNWIKNEQAKIKNNGKQTGSKKHLVTPDQLDQVYRELLAEGYE